LALEEGEIASAHKQATADKQTPAPRPRLEPGRRKSLPAHLPRIEVIIEPETTSCPCCGSSMHVIGEEKSERLDVIPAQHRILVTRRPKYGCRACAGAVVQAAAPERLIRSGLPTEALVAYVLVSKYAWHLPLYRQAQILLAQGIEIDRSVLAFWVGYAAAELMPLWQRMREILLGSPRLFVDETRAPVLDPGRGRTKTGYFWSIARDDSAWRGGTGPPAVVYTYAPAYLGTEFAYAEASPIPVFHGDGYFYQGTSATFDRAVRQDTWWALSSGARGAMTGSEAIWTWPSTALADSGSGTSQNWFVNVAGNIRTAYESLPGWHLLIPDASSVLVTSGRGTRATPFASGGGGGQYEPAFTDSFVTASRVPDGSLAVIYLSHGTTIGIDQAQMQPGYTATWIDPVTGAKTAATPGASYNSTAKGSNSAGDPDWVLALQASPGLLPQQLKQAAARRSVPAPDAGARATYT
jgi:transposase